MQRKSRKAKRPIRRARLPISSRNRLDSPGTRPYSLSGRVGQSPLRNQYLVRRGLPAPVRKRRRKNRRPAFLAAAVAAVFLFAAGAGVYWNLPGTKIRRGLERGAGYLAERNYSEAERVFQEVLALDGTEEQAYRGLADGYLAQGMQAEAETALLDGVSATGSQVLLQNYCATVLNDVVERTESARDGARVLALALRCLPVLQKDQGNEDALSLLSSLAERFYGFGDADRLWLENAGSGERLPAYLTLMEQLTALDAQVMEQLATLDAQARDGLKSAYLAVLEEWIFGGQGHIYLSLDNRDRFLAVLSAASDAGSRLPEGIYPCLERQREVSDFFAPVFDEFEERNFETARELLKSEEFLALRDAFIRGEMPLWKSSGYVPVTRGAIALERGQSGWQFSYVEDVNLFKPTGTIRFLAEKMMDLDVQRSAIEYVPAYNPEEYYPHVEYEIIYWKTRVSGIATDMNGLVSRMNYRFARKVYTETGMEAEEIYDWGGPNEERKTLES